MKTMVKLAVLFVALLLVNSMAFAAIPCPGSCSGLEYCYSVAGTDLDDPSNSGTVPFVSMCISGNSSYICENGNEMANGTLFPQGLNLQMLVYPLASSPTPIGYITFHGSWANHNFNGIGFDVGGHRWLVHGYLIPCL